ncbi:MAG: hypothetical protein GVY16_04735 [Planctomycetes bacterium]|jgi:hypothetical protein|nr:hypothetical protein [Phycisphaerae bacterium]NBB95028.1 hypothetical protein [Planctomycetota bacterium]
MTADRIDRLRETTSIGRVDRRRPDEQRRQKDDRDKRQKQHDEDDSQADVEDLIDHRLELLAEDDEPVALDEDLPHNRQNDLDLLL